MRRAVPPLLILAALVVLFALSGRLREVARPAPPPPCDFAAPVGTPSAPVPASPAEPLASPVPEDSVEGYVLDRAGGAPVGGARLIAASGRIGAQTDAAGAWRLPEKAARGEWRVVADGYAAETLDIGGEDITAARRVPTVWLAKVRARVPGRVVDFDGRPVPGARVAVDLEWPPFTADETGAFGPFPVSRFTVHYRAWSPEHPLVDDDWEPIDPADPPAELVVELGPAAFARGIVVDEAGAPVAGAAVFARREPDALRLVTGPDGRFRWPLSPGDAVDLEAESDGRGGSSETCAGASARIVVRPGDLGPRVHRAPPPPPEAPPPDPASYGTLCVSVARPGGGPFPGVLVEVTARGLAFPIREVTGPDGVASLRVPGGHIEIAIRCGWGEFPMTREFPPGGTDSIGPVSFPVPAAASPFLVEELEPAVFATATGIVTDGEGRPFPDADVASPRGFGGTDRRGRFTVEAGEPGETVEIRVEAAGYPVLRVPAVAGGPPVTVRLPGRGAIRVGLRNAPAGRGEAAVEVFASSLLEEHLVESPPEMRHVEDGGDSLRIDAPAGTWPVLVRVEPGEWVFFPSVQVRAGEETEVTYDFPRFGDVEVRLTDPEGAPVPGAEIAVADTAGCDALGFGDEHQPVFEGPVPCGVHRLLVVAEDFAPFLTDPVDLRRDSEVDVRLSRGGRVRGKVVDAAGEPVEGAVSVLLEVGPPLFRTRLDENGTFEVWQTLAPGPARLRIERDGRDPVVREVEIVMGETTEARLVVD